ncbi:hypothetical protein [Nannocystis radixulma]|uniref:Uncharacterized protein n=1 Tax=Nannocystis radixulma TaxID=2995305 RepID=A0ABT5B958_9BACT|nr:hypothetical protein [Nannocystis radixulma]MDC0670669.1 hypothetical protein [Nannocystis radixulma]
MARRNGGRRRGRVVVVEDGERGQGLSRRWLGSTARGQEFEGGECGPCIGGVAAMRRGGIIVVVEDGEAGERFGGRSSTDPGGEGSFGGGVVGGRAGMTGLVLGGDGERIAGIGRMVGEGAGREGVVGCGAGDGGQ